MTTKPIDVRAFAHALAHEFDSQRMSVQADAVRCAMQAASEGARVPGTPVKEYPRVGSPAEALATIARLTEERDDANARAKAAWERADRKTGVCDLLRSEVSDLRDALALAAKANEHDGDLRAVEPITQSAPLKVGDRVRLKDATVDELPSTMSDCFRVMIDGEVTPHGDNPGTIIYRSAIAGRVTP